MSQVLLWRDDDLVELECEEQIVTHGISQICCVDSFVFVISKHGNELHSGEIKEVDNKLHLKLFNNKINVRFIACSSSKDFLFVTDDWKVYSTNPGNLDEREEIIIEEEAKICIHGHSTPKQRVRVKSIASSEHGTLFLSQSGHLWASGDYPQLDVKITDGIKRVRHFIGRNVVAIASGLSFSVALVHKRDLSFVDRSNNGNESEEAGDVFVVGCSKCFSESTVSLPSHLSLSDVCPLGLPLRKFSVDHSTSSTISRENNEKKSIDGTTSPSTEDEVVPPLQTFAPQEDQSDVKSKVCISGDPAQVDGDKEEKTGSAESEGEKKNSRILNTEVARQFLTRPLSWVSSYGNAGEEFLAEYTEGTSRLVRLNVSNVANLVYEGVRTVGDKVATLSRHVSGGSDSCTGNEDSFEELIIEDDEPDNASLMKLEDFLGSSSAGTSDHEGDAGLETMDLLNCCERGLNILGAELYSWGSVIHGQLGIGDCLKRDRPALVGKLTCPGVQKVYCGKNHAVTLTLDGRMFAWGSNGSNQIDWKGSLNSSSPLLVCCGSEGSGKDRIWDIACGDRRSLMLTHGGDVFVLQKHKNSENSEGPLKLPLPHPNSLEEGTVAQKQLLAHGPLSWCSVHPKQVSPAVQDLALEQTFLEEGLLVQLSLTQPFLKKLNTGGAVLNSHLYSKLCNAYSDVLSFAALNCSSLWYYAEHGGDASNVAMVRYVDEHVRVYKKLVEAACNVLSVSGFASMASIIEPSQRLCDQFADRLPPLRPTKKGSRRNANEATFACALFHPLSRLNVYKCILQSLMRCNSTTGPSEPWKSAIWKKLQAALSKWESLCDLSDLMRREADSTRRFWESAGRVLEAVRTPVRRWVRDSRTHPIQVMNSGRFSSHWLVLFNDVLVHVVGSSLTLHFLCTVWVEPIQEDDSNQFGLSLTMPEESLLLSAATPQEKSEWLHALQGCIQRCLGKSHGFNTARNALFLFAKPGPLKQATYRGRWLNGKMKGWGCLEWPDGRLYVGQFMNNQQHGFGRMNMPNGDHYEGQWRDGMQSGRGVLKYADGDVYDGHFKDGLPHGHGTRKEGHFTASVASLYIGEWVSGVKQGYGVMDKIFTGEKFLGCWSNNMKHGCGIIVTLDGIYYEGVFMQDVLTGHGVMVLEDGAHYEGEFKSTGCFNGKGTLTLNTGDCLEGTLQGMWNEGVKVHGTLFRNPGHNNTASPIPSRVSTPSSFGKLCVPPNQKWKSIFRQCLASLAIPPAVVDCIAGGTRCTNDGIDSQRLWSSLAVAINTSFQEAAAMTRANCITRKQENLTELDTIPEWGKENITQEVYQKIHRYLVKAFESHHHPLGMLLADLSAAYTATYGGVRVHPLLLSHAVAELHSLVARIYEVVRLLFPALPQYGQERLLNKASEDEKSEDEEELHNQEEWEVVSAPALLHPFLLPRVHAALFVLYALNNKAEDDAYWKRLLKWNKQPDLTLLAFLGIDQKFWTSYSGDQSSNGGTMTTGPKPPFSPMREQLFTEAIETLQLLKTTFSPLEKLLVIRNTFEQLTQAVKKCMGSDYFWTMDELFPVFHFVVVRSRILQLGSEINFIEDFMERHLQNGELGVMFTTLKACYYQILQEKISMSN